MVDNCLCPHKCPLNDCSDRIMCFLERKKWEAEATTSKNSEVLVICLLMCSCGQRQEDQTILLDVQHIWITKATCACHDMPSMKWCCLCSNVSHSNRDPSHGGATSQGAPQEWFQLSVMQSVWEREEDHLLTLRINVLSWTSFPVVSAPALFSAYLAKPPNF